MGPTRHGIPFQIHTCPSTGLTAFALVVAGASILVSVLRLGNFDATARHGVVLLLPLAAITWPEVLDAAFRYSRSGFSHGGEGPAPGVVIRIGAFVLLAALIAAHHLIGR